VRLSNNRITDLSPLTGLTELTGLQLGNDHGDPGRDPLPERGHRGARDVVPWAPRDAGMMLIRGARASGASAAVRLAVLGCLVRCVSPVHRSR